MNFEDKLDIILEARIKEIALEKAKELAAKYGLSDSPVANKMLEYAANQTRTSDGDFRKSTGEKTIKNILRELEDGSRLVADVALASPGGLTQEENPGMPHIDQARKMISPRKFNMEFSKNKPPPDIVAQMEKGSVEVPVIIHAILSLKNNADVWSFLESLPDNIAHLFYGIAFGYGIESSLSYTLDKMKREEIKKGPKIIEAIRINKNDYIYIYDNGEKIFGSQNKMFDERGERVHPPLNFSKDLKERDDPEAKNSIPKDIQDRLSKIAQR